MSTRRWCYSVWHYRRVEGELGMPLLLRRRHRTPSSRLPEGCWCSSLDIDDETGACLCTHVAADHDLVGQCWSEQENTQGKVNR